MTDAPQPGTVIHGTLRNQDLLPAFLDVLETLDPQAYDDFAADTADLFRDMEADELWNTERATEAVMAVMDEIDVIASEFGMRFGAHEGDGADFGFWHVEEDF